MCTLRLQFDSNRLTTYGQTEIKFLLLITKTHGYLGPAVLDRLLRVKNATRRTAQVSVFQIKCLIVIVFIIINFHARENKMKKQISMVESKFCAGIKPIDLRKQISKLSFSVTRLFHFDSDFLLER